MLYTYKQIRQLICHVYNKQQQRQKGATTDTKRNQSSLIGSLTSFPLFRGWGGECKAHISYTIEIVSIFLQKAMNNFATFFKFFFFQIFIYFWDRERQSMNGGGAEREGDTESEAGSRLWAIRPEPVAGLELTDREIVTWLKSDA